MWKHIISFRKCSENRSPSTGNKVPLGKFLGISKTGPVLIDFAPSHNSQYWRLAFLQSQTASSDQTCLQGVGKILFEKVLSDCGIQKQLSIALHSSRLSMVWVIALDNYPNSRTLNYCLHFLTSLIPWRGQEQQKKKHLSHPALWWANGATNMKLKKKKQHKRSHVQYT